MFKFFRSIRQGLVNEGKTSKYFRYALGEIVLIVVGILIAVQIGEWKQASDDENLKDRYALRLIENLKKDLQGFEAQIGLTQLGVDLADLLMLAAQDPEVVRDRTVEFMTAVLHRKRAGQGPLFSDTYEDLLSTGNLNLMDDDLKNAIFGYYQFDARLRQGTSVEEDFTIQYNRLRRWILTTEQTNWLYNHYNTALVSNIESIKAATYDAESVVEAAYRLQKNTELVQLLPDIRFNLLSSIRRTYNRMRKANELLEILQEEIAK